MNLFAHVTPSEFPLWIASLAAGVAVGVAITLALVGYIRRKG